MNENTVLLIGWTLGLVFGGGVVFLFQFVFRKLDQYQAQQAATTFVGSMPSIIAAAKDIFGKSSGDLAALKLEVAAMAENAKAQSKNLMELASQMETVTSSMNQLVDRKNELETHVVQLSTEINDLRRTSDVSSLEKRLRALEAN